MLPVQFSCLDKRSVGTIALGNPNNKTELPNKQAIETQLKQTFQECGIPGSQRAVIQKTFKAMRSALESKKQDSQAPMNGFEYVVLSNTHTLRSLIEYKSHFSLWNIELRLTENSQAGSKPQYYIQVNGPKALGVTATASARTNRYFEYHS